MTTQPQISEAEQALLDWGIDYWKGMDGVIVVDGNIDLGGKGLMKLPDLSKIIVNGSFWCNNNQLTSLEGAPAFVGKHFSCDLNKLASLKGAPASVGGNYWCNHNLLTSLEYAPPAINGVFGCINNQLISLADAPRMFEKLYSDFGEFTGQDGIPEELRISPEAKMKAQQAYRQKLEKISAAGEKKQPFKMHPSIRFKTRPK